MGTSVEKDAGRRPELHRGLSAFVKVTAAAEDSTQLDDLLLVVATQVSEMVGVGRCSIHLRDERAGLYVGCVCVGAAKAADIKRSRAGCPADGVTRELLRTHRPAIVENAERDPRTVQSTVRFWRIRSIMAVPMLFRDEVIGVMFLDDEAASHAFSEADAELALTFAELAAAAVMHAQQRAELRAEVDAGKRHIRALQRATALDERLSDLVLEGRSLRDLMVALAELLGKPCAVFGLDGVRLAGAAPPGVDEQLGPRLLEAPLGKHPDVVQAMAVHDGSRAFIVGPLPHVGVAHRHVVAPVLLEGQTWGNLVVMEYPVRFVGSDMLILRRAATLVALQVSVDRRAVEAELDAGASLAGALLTGEGEPAIVQRRADHLGIRLDTPRVVMVLAARSGHGTLCDPRSAAAAFAALAPELEVHVTPVPGGLAVLAALRGSGDERALAELAEEALKSACERLKLSGGLSSVRADPAGYRAAFDEARRVADCVLRFGRRGGPLTSTAERLGGGLVFLATADRDDVVRFADETLGWLVDDPSMGDLLDTLCSFFDNVASIRRCATSLGVHENTIRYRLGRIAELSGLAVAHDPDAQLQARLSMLVLRLQGRVVVGGTPSTAIPPRKLEVVAGGSH